MTPLRDDIATDVLISCCAHSELAISKLDLRTKVDHAKERIMKVKTIGSMAVLCLKLALSVDRTLAAQESDTELAKKTQNPMADLISVPFQNNFNYCHL